MNESVLELCLLLFVGEIGVVGSANSVSADDGSSLGSGVAGLFLLDGESKGDADILNGTEGSISTLCLHPMTGTKGF